MNATSLSIWSGALTILLLGAAVAVDVRSRRIPNSLTFTTIAIALIARSGMQGWLGLTVALGGAVVAPLLLLVLHAGKGPGMGDLKLAAAVGSLIGPSAAVAAMLASAIAGGVLAVILMMKPGGLLSSLINTFLIGIPKFGKPTTKSTINSKFEHAAGSTAPNVAAMPYAVAIAAGTLATLVVCWWTGNNAWFFSLIT